MEDTRGDGRWQRIYNREVNFHSGKWKPGRIFQGIWNITKPMCQRLNSVASQYIQQCLESDSSNAENLLYGFSEIIANTFM